MKRVKIVLGLLFLGMGTMAYAQTTQASITGKVNGAGNVGQNKIKVTIVNESTGLEQKRRLILRESIFLRKFRWADLIQ